MSRAWIITLSALGLAAAGSFAIAIVWDWAQGLGGIHVRDEWNPAGRRVALEALSIWKRRVGPCYYWSDNGQLDVERSGYFDRDDRVRPLTPEELERSKPERFVPADLFAILRAESLFHARNGRCVPAGEIFESSEWSETTKHHNPRPLDPWGRPYQITITHAGDGVTAACRGRDGVEGGTGEDADQRLDWDVTKGYYGGERP